MSSELKKAAQQQHHKTRLTHHKTVEPKVLLGSPLMANGRECDQSRSTSYEQEQLSQKLQYQGYVTGMDL